MKAVQEITKWEGDIQPNHTYLLDGDRMLAYIPQGSKQATYFKSPITIRLSGRKFQELKQNPFRIENPETRIRVEGSKGSIYWVDPEARSCTCAGYSFRGKCKHVDQVLKGK